MPKALDVLRTTAATSLAAGIALGALSAGALGCSTDATTTTVLVPTSVGVDPVYFMGQIPCGPFDGAARAYVATLTDRTTGAQLAPSPPVSCAVPVAFENVVVDHTYSADIQVFDVPIETIDATSTPRWTTTCAADGVGAAQVYTNQRTVIQKCVELVGSGGTGTTRISIDTALLGAKIGCSGTGAIDKLSVALAGGATMGTPPPKQTVGCGQGPVIEEAGLTPGVVYTFRVEAFEAGATDARWASTCTAVAKQGVQVAASCDALSEYGFVRVDGPQIVTDAKRTCGTTGADVVGTYDTSFDEAPNVVASQGTPCAQAVTLGPFLQGSHAGEIFMRTPLGALEAHAICFAAVVPAATVTATCVPD